eukprot:RCo046345
MRIKDGKRAVNMARVYPFHHSAFFPTDHAMAALCSMLLFFAILLRVSMCCILASSFSLLILGSHGLSERILSHNHPPCLVHRQISLCISLLFCGWLCLQGCMCPHSASPWWLYELVLVCVRVCVRRT